MNEPLCLPEPPSQVVMAGAPATGRYQGCIERMDWRGLAGEHRRPPWWRWLHHKRWQYVGIGSDEVFIGVAVVHLGWGSTAFAYAFDRASRRLLADWSQDGAAFMGAVGERPVHGAWAHFRGLGAQLKFEHLAAENVLRLRVQTRAMRLEADALLNDGPPWLLAVGPVADGVAHATQKSSALKVDGALQVGARTIDLSAAVASVDSSNGWLPHRTAWRWASAHSPTLGFNLQAGYFGAHENALWLDGRVIPLAAANFRFDEQQPLAPWHVETVDGLLDLTFTPEGARQDRRNLGLVASRYVQPVGTFSGTVRASRGSTPRSVQGLLGVTEDHASRW